MVVGSEIPLIFHVLVLRSCRSLSGCTILTSCDFLTDPKLLGKILLCWSSVYIFFLWSMNPKLPDLWSIDLLLFFLLMDRFMNGWVESDLEFSWHSFVDFLAITSPSAQLLI